MPDNIGSALPTHPLPLRLRNCNIPKLYGGAFGFRGTGYSKMRERVLWLAGRRSSATGLDESRTTLEVDHINPYRIGGITPETNSLHNLRVMDTTNNAYLDNATTFREKKIRRRLRTF